MRDTTQIRAQVRAVNDANGWGQDFSREVSSNPIVSLALIGTEVGTELIGAAAEGNIEHICEELADTIIRCLDLDTLLERQGLNGSIEVDWLAEPATTSANDWGSVSLGMKLLIDDAVQAWRKNNDPARSVRELLSQLCGECCARINGQGRDAATVVEEKIATNATRGHRHGGRRC